MGVFVIAEAGVNHNAERDLALALVDAAAEAGADAVKFQTFQADALVSPDAPKAAYQIETTDARESQLTMLKRLELPRDWHFALAERCRERGIRFLSAPFDAESLRFLVEDVKLDTLKIPSGEITNGPLLLEAGMSGCDVILSTGMSTLDEVGDALGVLAFGLVRAGETPSKAAFADALESDAGRKALRDKVTLLHCTSQYPAPAEDANLRAMETMREAFGLRVGLSDHTQGIAIPIAAAALGADVIEKHFTIDRGLPGPDHKASLEPDELKEMIARIRAGGRAPNGIEAALGDGVKRPRPSELDNRAVVRKSLVAARAIGRGETIGPGDLAAKRPGTGVSPMEYWDRLGREPGRDLAEGEPL